LPEPYAPTEMRRGAELAGEKVGGCWAKTCPGDHGSDQRKGGQKRRPGSESLQNVKKGEKAVNIPS